MLVDLCRGPHLRHTGQIGGLKLLSVSHEDWVRLRFLGFHSSELRKGKVILRPFSALIAKGGIWKERETLSLPSRNFPSSDR